MESSQQIAELNVAIMRVYQISKHSIAVNRNNNDDNFQENLCYSLEYKKQFLSLKAFFLVLVRNVRTSLAALSFCRKIGFIKTIR